MASVVNPSMRRMATLRRTSSPRRSRSLRYSSATMAANSGVGSEPTARARTSSSEPGSASSLAGRTWPPPRFCRSWRRACALTFRVVMTTRSRQRSSRSASCGNFPRASPRNRLSKALKAASSSSLAASRRTRCGAEPRSRQVHHPREVTLPERLRRRDVAGLHPGDPSRDRAVTRDPAWVGSMGYDLNSMILPGPGLNENWRPWTAPRLSLPERTSAKACGISRTAGLSVPWHQMVVEHRKTADTVRNPGKQQPRGRSHLTSYFKMPCVRLELLVCNQAVGGSIPLVSTQHEAAPKVTLHEVVREVSPSVEHTIEEPWNSPLILCTFSLARAPGRIPVHPQSSDRQILWLSY